MNDERLLPIGIRDFAGLRNDGYIYIDKTMYIERMQATGKHFFLSRPRRFGRSLFVSALDAYWSGRKELFKGLEIEKAEEPGNESWIKYPVFHFDFNRENYLQSGALEGVLEDYLSGWEETYQTANMNASLAIRFQNLLKKANEITGRRCVILVDEYDKPLLDVMDDPVLDRHNRAVMKGFFSSLKSYDKYIRFVFITGVTRFNKVSIFSDLNHLNDISMVTEYAAVCGITEEEIACFLKSPIEDLAKRKHISTDECRKILRKRYDGYHFAPSIDDMKLAESVYNPDSLLSALANSQFDSYWFASGTPSFLIKKIKAMDFDIRQFSGGKDGYLASADMLGNYTGDEADLDVVPLLYQTGYLTLADYDPDGRYFVLGYPNEEVKYGFLKCLLPEYTGGTQSRRGNDILSLNQYLRNGNTDAVRNVLVSLFAGIPYSTDHAPFEHYFQSIIYIIFTMLGQYVHCEQHMYTGRIDCVVETDRYVYLFEFKRDGSADSALSLNSRVFLSLHDFYGYTQSSEKPYFAAFLRHFD